MTTETKTTPKAKTPAKVTHKTITEALVAFQADLPSAPKNGVNPHFKSKFTTLDKLTEVVIPKLNEQGIAYTTSSRVTEEGKYILEATLTHLSGEKLTAEFPIAETNPQKIGSSISYFRRYGLAQLTGVVSDEDDDGNAASAPPPAPLRGVREKVAPTSTTSGEGVLKKRIREEFIEAKKIDKDAVNSLVTQYKGEGLSGVKLYETVITALEKL